MTLTETAIDREMLLVPVAARPETAPPSPDGDARPADGGGEEPRPPRSGLRSVAQAALVVLAVLSIGMIVQLAVLSPMEYRSDQVALTNQFRTEVALGTAPIGPIGTDGHLLPLGTPVALLSIPSIGLRAVVVEGTTASVLAKGPGHLRNTVFPGGAGTSVVLGRASAYGGPFGQIGQLRAGQLITVTTQVGTSRFQVVRVRPAGAKVRPATAGTARLTLGTASGPSFAPSGVLWVDADKIGKPLAATTPSVQLLSGEKPLASDTSTLWALFLWLEALGVLLAGAVWSWRRWGRAQTWIVFTAPMLLVWTFIADQVARLLPNLL